MPLRPHTERRVPHYEGNKGCMVVFVDELGAEVMNSSPVVVIICFSYRFSVNQKALTW